MSCDLPVCSPFYSFPSSAQLCFAGSWTLPATLPRILPTDYLLDPGRGTHTHMSARKEESLMETPVTSAEGGKGIVH